MRSIEGQGRLIALNTLLNFIGQLIPVLVGVVTIPLIIHGLGLERFGILSLAWAILGCFSLLDLGMGRATTKFAAEILAKNDIQKIPSLVWTSITLLTFLGLLGSLVFAIIVPVLVDKVFKISPALVREVGIIFYIIAGSIPLVLISSGFIGVLEAGQRFDLVNAVRVPSSILTFVVPAVALLLDLRLPAIVALLVMVRLAACGSYLALCLKFVPVLKHGFSFDFRKFRILFSFGGWITISNIIGPILLNLDRFLIGSLVSLTAVAYYTAPYEVVTRLWIIPGSLVATLFPAFSGLNATGAQEKLAYYYGRSINYLLLILGPMILVFVIFSGDILKLWLGNDFAQKSMLVFQILALGVLVNSLAQVPYSLLQGLGRADITATLHLAELLLYIALAWFLIKRIGITGAALAWTLRVGIDALALFSFSWKLHRMSLGVLVNNGLLRSIVAILVLTGAMLIITISLPKISLFQVILAGLLIVAFMLVAWHYVLDEIDRTKLKSTMIQIRIRR